MKNRSEPGKVNTPRPLAHIAAFKLSALYALAGALWILFSDRIVHVLGWDMATVTRMQTAKGWFFIGVTAFFLYLFVRRAFSLLDLSQRESARQKDLMVQASHAGQVALWERDLRSGALLWSESLDTLMGCEPGTFPQTFAAWEEIIHPEDRPRVLKCLADHLEHRTPYDVEYRVRRSDGTCAWWRDRGMCQWNEAGLPLQMSGACVDITERKEAEIARLQSEERFRQVADNTGMLVWEVDTAGLYLYGSDAAEEILGYPAAEMIGQKHIYDLFAPDVRESLKQTLLETFAQRKPFAKITIPTQRKDGRIVLLEATGNPIFDEHGALVGYRGVDRDVTERSRSETAMLRQNAYLEALHETTLGLMGRTELSGLFQAIVGRAARFVNADEGWIALYDAEKNDFEFKAAVGQGDYRIGSRFEVGRGIAGEVWRTDRTVLLDNYQTWPGHAPTPGYRLRRATVAIPLRSAERLAGVLGLSLYDPSRAFKTDEMAMLERFAELASIALDNARLYDQMRRDLAERKRLEKEHDLIQAQLLQSQKMEALGTLAGGVAHDLNNVLGVLVGYAELLLEKVTEDNPLRRYAHSILQSGLRGAAIIQDLLTLARRGVSVSEVVNLNTVVCDYLKTPEFEALRTHHPRVRFLSDLDRDLLNVKGSPIHLSKTIMNLVANAAEAIPERGEVTIRTENRCLEEPLPGLGEKGRGDHVVLTVSDTGRGIAANDLDKIFEPFYTKKVMGRSGTGLGLAVVWGTVKDHGGHIDVQSQEGRGSTFTLYFPVTRQDVAKPQEAISAELYRGRGETILVVDDVPEQRDLAVNMLERLGYRVSAVSSGEEAIAHLRTERVDLVVLDMIMDPGMDGLETYQRILAIRPGQKAVIVSGFSETDRVGRAQELGAGAYVRKPYILEKIGLAIRTELDRKASPPV